MSRHPGTAAVLVVLGGLVLGCGGDPTPAPRPSPSTSESSSSSSSTSPSPSAAAPVLGASHVLVPDPAGDALLAITGPVEGEIDDGPLQVWRWTGLVWTQVAPTLPWPSARSFFGIALDEQRHVLVLHGGDTATGPSDETWEWDGARWEEHDGSAPGPRLAAPIAYDPAGAGIVLYGGDDGAGGQPGDTWSWDGSSWRRLTTRGPSPVRWPAAIGADPGSGQLLLYGGHQVVDTDLPDALGDTWLWQGGEWTEQPQGGAPGRRVNAALVSHPRHGLLLVGGRDVDEEAGDVWRWSRAGWELLAEDVFPPRQAFGLAYDPDRDVVVLTGGLVEPGELARRQDVWEWSGALDQPAELVSDRPPA